MTGENKCLYFLKGLSCLTVVLLHVWLPGHLGGAVFFFCKYPVPIFFMLSGYFCYSRDTKWIAKAFRKTLWLLVWSEAACAAIWFFFDRGSFSQLMASCLSWKTWGRTLFCGTLFNGTLWYLYAMLWVWLMLYMLKKHTTIGWCYYLILPLLLVGIAMELHLRWIQHITDNNIEHVYIFRNALFYGLPFVLLGHFLAEKENWIREHISNNRCLLLFGAGGILMIIEYLIWPSAIDFWFSTVLIATAMFLYAMQHPDQQIVPIIAKIGKQYSMWIYVSHFPIRIITNSCIAPYIGQSLYEWLRVPLVLTGSLLIAVIIERIQKILKKKIPRLGYKS